jgi:vitamin-K-epoxide reductase (warfarin-sensitive)
MRYLIALLALAGIIDSALALRIHYEDPAKAPPCAVTEKFDCGAVNHSRFAVFPPASFDEAPGSSKLHVPIALIGMIGYLLIGVCAFLRMPWLTLHLSEAGFAAAVFLSYLEAYVLEKWCIYCLWSLGIVTAILVCSIIGVFWHKTEPTKTYLGSAE